jgi:hypothetical protein
MSHISVGQTLRFRNLLVVIKQTAYEEYSQVCVLVATVDEIHDYRSFLIWPGLCLLGLIEFLISVTA